MIDTENIKDVYNTVKDVHSLQDLNDIMAEKIFSITREKVIENEETKSKTDKIYNSKLEKYTTEEVGKATIRVPTNDKIKANNEITKNINEIEKIEQNEIQEQS